MKSGSVASVAVLLTLGVMAGVFLTGERSTVVMSESEDFFGSLAKRALRMQALQKITRVQAVVDKLGLDDNRDLYRLYDYIMNQEYNKECSSGGKACSMIAISFTVGSESDAHSEALRFKTAMLDSFDFSPKVPGLTDMKAKKVKFPINDKYKLEPNFDIKAISKNAAKVRINWMLNRVWNAGANRNEFLVSVAPNNGGWNCYSKEKDNVGSMVCYKSWGFDVSSNNSYPWQSPYSDPWVAFDNAVIARRGQPRKWFQ